MDNELFVLSAGVSGAIGTLAPFALPSFFRLLEKIFKRSLTVAEKRLSITLLSGAVSIILILARYQWAENMEENLQFFFINFVAIKGMTQTVYELLIKSVPGLDKKFS